MATSTYSLISTIDLINLSTNLAQVNLGYLGASIGILVILGGVFVYFNINPIKESLNKQEEKIDNLKKEADKLLKLSEEKINVALESFDKEQEKKLSVFLEQNNEKLLLETKDKITNLEKTIYEKIESVAENKDFNLKEIILSDVDNRLRSLEKNLNVEAKNSKNDIIKIIKDATKELEGDIKELKVYKYAQEGKMGAIIYSIELLKDDIDRKDEYDWRIPSRLEELKNNIKDTKLDPDYITQIEEQLSRIDNERKYGPLINEVKEQYIKKQATSSDSNRTLT